MRRWKWISWSTLGLANMLGLNKKPPSWEYGVYRWESGIYRRASNFVSKLVPRKFQMMIDHSRVGDGYWSGVVGIRDRGGLEVIIDGDEYTLNPLPPLERLFRNWEEREWKGLETAH